MGQAMSGGLGVDAHPDAFLPFLHSLIRVPGGTSRQGDPVHRGIFVTHNSFTLHGCSLSQPYPLRAEEPNGGQRFLSH